jgi:hypothetical protein
MKKLFMIAATAALAFGMGSCAKNSNIDTDPIDGDQARLGISFTMPSSGAATRAEERVGRTEENTVASVSIFLFDKVTGAPLAKPAPADRTVTVDATTFTSASGTFTMREGNYIETVAVGAATAYVVVNMPTDLRIKEYTSAADLLDEVKTVTQLTADNAFVMISDATPVNLVAYGEDETLSTVNATVKRVVAKVIATTKATDKKFFVDWESVETEASENLMTYELIDFAIQQDKTSSYLGKNTTSYGNVSDFAASKAKKGIVKVNGNTESDLNSANYFYVGENFSAASGGNSFGNTTYAMVRTRVTMSKVATWDSENSKVVWAAPTAAYTGTGAAKTLYVIPDMVNNNTTYIVENAGPTATIKQNGGTTDLTVPQTVKDIVYGMGVQDDPSTTSINEAKPLGFYIYENGDVNFQVWLHGTEGNYRIDRNQLINIDITGVKATEGFFPGYPGDVDPGDGDDPNNPDPEDPDKPIVPDAAQLEVVFNVMKWDYIAVGTELTK